MKVLTRTARVLTVTAVAAACVAGTMAAHDLPTARAKAVRTARAAQWDRAIAQTRARRLAVERQFRRLRARYDALVARAHRRDARLVRTLQHVRHEKLRRWRGAR